VTSTNTMTLYLKTLPFFGGESRGGYRSTWYFYDDEQVLHKLECQDYPDSNQRWAIQSQKTKAWENVYDIDLFLSSGSVTTYLERMQKAFNNNELLRKHIHKLVGPCSFETTLIKIWSTPQYKVEIDIFKCPSEANIIVRQIGLKTPHHFNSEQLLNFMNDQPRFNNNKSHNPKLKPKDERPHPINVKNEDLQDEKALRAQLHKEYSCMFIHLTKERRLYYQTCKEQDDPYKAVYIEETTRRNQKNEF
jgi:hypothetical protein